MSERIDFALEHGGLVLPERDIVLFGTPGTADLSAFPRDGLRIVQPLQPDAAQLAARGLDVMPQPQGLTGASAAIVSLPRARDRAQDVIARACAAAPELVVVDGAKTDGIDSILKAVRARQAVDGPVSKAHGKVFWFRPSADFSDWRKDPAPVGDFVTAPGVFSADGPDPASALLARSLPPALGTDVADFGAGWGYLSRTILERAEVETLHLVEADAIALDCAKRNLSDPRARFHWADATAWQTPAFLDAVVMNPPFHVGRKADPALGRAFIAAAAAALKPSGHLWLVANRHLPYETALADLFRKVEEVAGTPAYKVLHATQRTRTRR